VRPSRARTRVRPGGGPCGCDRRIRRRVAPSPLPTGVRRPHSHRRPAGGLLLHDRRPLLPPAAPLGRHGVARTAGGGAGRHNAFRSQMAVAGESLDSALSSLAEDLAAGRTAPALADLTSVQRAFDVARAEVVLGPGGLTTPTNDMGSSLTDGGIAQLRASLAAGQSDTTGAAQLATEGATPSSSCRGSFSPPKTWRSRHSGRWPGSRPVRPRS